MKIAIVLKSCDNQREIHKISLFNKQRYAEKWGYTVIDDIYPKEEHRSWPWAKIPAVIRALESGYDWVFWSDADSLIMNYHTSLESLIDDRYSFVASFYHMSYQNIDSPENHDWVFHSGNFLVKNESWTLAFLNEVYNYTKYWEVKSEEESTITEFYRDRKYIRGRFLRKKISDFCTTDPDTSFDGALPIYKPGDFIVHFPGMPIRIKYRYMNLYKDMVMK